MRILETQRLLLREMTQADYPALAEILQDRVAMFAYEHAFSDEETQTWLDRMRERYAKDGFGLWAVVCKETGEMIGQCGLTWQNYEGERVLEWARGIVADSQVDAKAIFCLIVLVVASAVFWVSQQ